MIDLKILFDDKEKVCGEVLTLKSSASTMLCTSDENKISQENEPM